MTVDLPDDLKAVVIAEARRRGVNEAEVIRLAIDEALQRPKPPGRSGRQSDAVRERADDLFEDFGDR